MDLDRNWITKIRVNAIIFIEKLREKNGRKYMGGGGIEGGLVAGIRGAKIKPANLW